MDNQTILDEFFMRLAIEEAKKAEQIDEVPVGAVCVILLPMQRLSQ